MLPESPDRLVCAERGVWSGNVGLDIHTVAYLHNRTPKKDKKYNIPESNGDNFIRYPTSLAN